MKTFPQPEALGRLNRAAAANAFDLEALDWSLEVDRGKPWAPEGLDPLAFTPSWESLDAVAKLRMNQLNALALVEKFIWFEERVVTAIGAIQQQGSVRGELACALRHVAEEETKHLAMFRRLLVRSEPSWYREGGRRLFQPTAVHRVAIDLIARHPGFFLSWTWLTIFVEERALFLARCYQRAERERPGSVDALHAQVHAFHLRDEARHINLDRHLLAALYDPQPAWKKAAAARILTAAIRGYVAGGASAREVLAQLGREHPHLREATIPRMLAELAGVARDPQYHARLFSRRAMPRTLALLAEYPEHARARAVFLAEAEA